MQARSSEDIEEINKAKSSWLKVAQAGWLVLAVLTFITLVASIPGYLVLFIDPDLDDSFAKFLSGIEYISIVFSVMAAVISLGLATLLYWRKRDDKMALFLAYFFLLYGLVMTGPLEALAYYLGVDQIALLAQTIFLLPVMVLFYIFPTGSFVPRWSRWLVLVSLLTAVPIFIETTNVGRSPQDAFSYITGIFLVLLLSVGFYGQIIRYQRISSPRERLQVKWVIYGLVIWILIIAISSGPYMYILTLPPDTPTPRWMAPLSIFWWIGLMVVPISFTVAILRHKLWDIDFIIRRTLVYGLLTSVLILIYLGSVVVLQSIFTTVSGQESAAAIVISTLVIAALFQPLRQRIQAAIDRRFYRRKYDAAQSLARFALVARDEVDLGHLTSSLIEVVEETMKPKQVSLWLRQVERVNEKP